MKCTQISVLQALLAMLLQKVVHKSNCFNLSRCSFSNSIANSIVMLSYFVELLCFCVFSIASSSANMSVLLSDDIMPVFRLALVFAMLTFLVK